MNWEAIGAVGEIVGAIAVVATLIYLAQQTRQNTKAVIAASSRNSNWGFAEFNERIAKDPELLVILRKSLQPDLSQFSDDEWNRFQFFARAQAGRVQDAHQQSQLGFYSEALADSQLDFMRALLENPAWKLFWDNEGGTWTPEFVQDVERRSPIGIGMLSFKEVMEQHNAKNSDE